MLRVPLANAFAGRYNIILFYCERTFNKLQVRCGSAETQDSATFLSYQNIKRRI
jgi:hypothetical protein